MIEPSSGTTRVTAISTEDLFEAFRTCLNTTHIEELSEKTLAFCCSFVGCPLGCVGYTDTETGQFTSLAMTRGAGGDPSRELHGLVLELHAAQITNHPTGKEGSIRRFLGVPCLFRGARVGVIGLANKETDFSDEDRRVVGAFADIYAAAVTRFTSERELTASRNRLASLYHEAPCGYQTLTPEGTIVEINDTALQLLGRERKEVVGKLNIGDLVTSTGLDLLVNQINELKAGVPAAPVELDLERPDGSRFPVLQSVTRTFDERGCPHRIRCTLIDISLRKALRETRDYLDTLFEASTSPILVWNSRQEISRVNHAFERLSGYAEASLLGRHLGILFPEKECAALLAQIRETSSGGRLESAELPICTAEGERKIVLWNSSNLYSEEGGELLATVMQGVDITERRQYERLLKESMEGAVQAIAATIEKRDPYTAGHQQRVARLAVAIAEEMGLSPQQIEGVHFGSLIHDIGKIAVPAEILNKPGHLEAIEHCIIQAHAVVGREILKGVRFPWPIVGMVHQHHERLDGSGYPQGLRGDTILLEARVLAVADVVEAMSSFRPYRPAVGLDKAMEEIARNSGRLYDPAAVAACIHVIKKGFKLGTS